MDRLQGPLQQQLLAQIRARLQADATGARLPSTRALAQRLGVSRNTVLRVYERLADEGYLEGRAGGGSRLRLPPPRPEPAVQVEALAPARWVALPEPRVAAGPPRAFRIGLPPMDLFPHTEWARLQRRVWRRAERGELGLGYGDPSGQPRLRAALADWLRQARGLHCGPDQILLTGGAQQAFALAGLALLAPGARAAVEAPGYHALGAALRLSGAELVGVPVDELGLRPLALEAVGACRLLAVTPAHHWPTGASLSLERRLALLDWARRHEAWLIEDDYAGEYRFDGQPLPALSALDTEGRCLLVGSFAKLLLPGLRLGYLVAPPALIPLLRRLRAALDRQPPLAEQEVLADFIEQGGLARHLRRARRTAAARREALLQAWSQTFGDRFPLQAPPSGLNVFLPLRDPRQEHELRQRARAAGLECGSLQEVLQLSAHPSRQAGLALGFGALPEPDISAAVQRLSHAWRGG